MTTSIQLSNPEREETPPRLRETRAAAADKFRTTLDALGIAQRRAGQWFDVDARSVRRWRRGDRHIPAGVRVVCNLLAMGVVTVEQVEAAALISTQTKGGGAEPLHVERPVPAEAAAAITPVKINGAPVSPAPEPAETLAEKVCRLTGCRWPIGDPRHSGFSFCCAPTSAGSPYCEAHHAAAHMPQPSSKTVPAHRPGFRPSASLAGSLAPVGVACVSGSRTLTPAGANG